MSKQYTQPIELFNLDAERELLGTLLLNNAIFNNIAEIVSAESFYEPVHERIFNAIRECLAEGEVANPITLKNRFDKDRTLESIGGSKYLVSLVSVASSIIDASHFARVVHKLYQKRQIIAWCQDAIASSMDAEADQNPDEITAKLSARLNDMASVDKRKKVISDTDATRLLVERMQLGEKSYSSGIAQLDDAMRGGFYPGKMYGFAAFSKVGKTILAATFSHNLASQGVKHLFIAGEMSAEEIQERVVARVLDAYPSHFTSGNPEFIDRVQRVVSRFKGHAIYQDAAGLTFDELKQYMGRAVYKLGVKGVILDYFQLVGGAKPRESEAKHLDQVAQWLADFGRQHRIFTIVTAQRNDEGDIRGSRGLRLACDQLYYLNREKLNQPQAWLEMNATRYTKWQNIGSQDYAGLMMNEKGPFFE